METLLSVRSRDRARTLAHNVQACALLALFILIYLWRAVIKGEMLSALVEGGIVSSGPPDLHTPLASAVGDL